MMKKTMIAFMLMAVMVLCLMAGTAFATDVNSGVFPTDTGVTWAYDPTTDTLTIRGNGIITQNALGYVSDDAKNATKLVVAGEDIVISISAFENCSTLTDVALLEGVTGIDSSAFKDCDNLTSVTIPGSVEIIDSNAFQSCKKLTSVTIAQGVKIIGPMAFESCMQLTNIIIPSGVTSIYENAFDACNQLSSITIPSTVTSIGKHAFNNCPKLTTVRVPCSWKATPLYPFDQNILTYDHPWGEWQTTKPATTTEAGEEKRTCLCGDKFETRPLYIAPTFAEDPQDTSVKEGSTFTFTASATGAPAPTYQWQTYQSGAWEDIPGATASTYTAAATLAMSGAQFRCVATNAGDSATSNAAVLTVNAKPVVLQSIAVTTPPAKTQYNEGETFDPTGMVVTATYSNGTTAPVTGYIVTDGTALAAGKTSVTISYTEGGMTKTTTQAITVNAAVAPIPPETPAVPQTGDDTPIFLWMSLCAIGLAGMALMLRNTQRKYRR